MTDDGPGPARPPAPLRLFAELAGTDDPGTAMDGAVASLLARHGGDVPPVGLRRLWEAFGADKTWTQDTGPHGRLDVVDGRYRIVVNRDQPWRRQRFTVAHELGHVLLFEALKDDPQALREVRAAEHWRDVERLCDRAASRLLVPPGRLADDLAAGPPTAAALRGLYDRYMVSWPVLLRAVAEAGPSSVSLWSRSRRHDGEPYAPRLSAAWSWPDGPFLPRGMTCKHVTPDLITRCYASGVASAGHADVDVSGRVVVTGPAVALPWEAPPRTPEFQGMPVADGPARPWDVVLVVTPDPSGDR